MKKIISLVVFAAALIWTWNLFHGASSAVAFETHADIQTKLAELIKESLIAKKPSASNVQVVRMWTESLGDNKVRAVFAYKFVEKIEGTEAGNETTEQTIEGEAILHREPSTYKSEDHWVVQSVRTTNDIVTFSEGSTVAPNMVLEPTTAAPAEQAPSTATPAPTTPEKK